MENFLPQTRFWLFAILVILGGTFATGTQTAENTNAEVRTLAEVPAATGGLSVDQSGNIYVADIGPAPNRRGMTIYKVTPNGDVSVFAENGNLLRPDGNAFDSKGNLYQASLLLNHIAKITPDGEVSIFVEGLRVPTGLVFDEDDNLYVTNCGANNIQKVNPEGESSTFAVNPLFRCPTGIALDNDKNLYVANFSNGLVAKVMPDGSVSQFANVPGNNNGHLVFDGEQLYTVSRGGQRIYTLSLEGELKEFAGTGQRGHEDGPVAAASFSIPFGIGMSPDGNTLYINEGKPTSGGQNNHPTILRMIVLNP